MATLSKKRIPRIPDQPLAFVLYVLRHCSPRMKWQMGIAYIFESTATASDMLVAWVLGRIVGVITSAGGHQLWHQMSHELMLLASLWMLRNLSYRGREYMERRIVPEVQNTTRALIFNRLIHQSQAFLHSNFTGVLANHVGRTANIIENLRQRVQYNIVPLVIRFVTAGILLWQITPMFAVFILSFLAVGMACAIWSAPFWTKLSTRQAEAGSRLMGYVADSITNLSLVQQNAGWREEHNRLHEVHDEVSNAFRARLTYVSWFWGGFDTAMTLFFCGFMALLAHSWQLGHVTTAQLAMSVGIVSNLFGAIAGTVWLLSTGFDDIGTLNDTLKKVSVPISVFDAPAASELSVTSGRIEFRDVTFSYGQGKKVFDKLTLDIPAGQKVGVVGISGSGKTTLCQLLMRAYDVTEGGIYIDGQNIADVTQDSLRASIAVIPQDPTLFHRTLADNIRYGRMAANDSDIKSAADAAAVAEFIEGLPQGYGTLVGERGVKLSGGQRQRVAIARAIVKGAPILLLDEATSALDSETEKDIQATMAAAMKGHTTLVIAHRLSTLSMMDRIVVMDEGRVIEDGSFSGLLEKKGIFYRLWTLQAGGFLPETLSAA